MKKNEHSLREMWDTPKLTNMHLAGVPKERNERLEKIIKENFPNMMRNINLCTEETRGIPNKQKEIHIQTYYRENNESQK